MARGQVISKKYLITVDNSGKVLWPLINYFYHSHDKSTGMGLKRKIFSGTNLLRGKL